MAAPANSTQFRNILAAVVLCCVAGAIGYIAFHDAPPTQPPTQPQPRLEPPSPPAAPQPQAPPTPDIEPEPAPTAPAPAVLPDEAAAPLPNVAVFKQRVAEFQRKMDKYRASQPVFAEFLNLIDDELIPLGQRAIDAFIDMPKLQQQPAPATYDGGQIVAAFMGGVTAKALQTAEAGQLELTEPAMALLRKLAADAEAAGDVSSANPFTPGTAEYYSFDIDIGLRTVTAVRSMFFDILQFASPELEQERRFLEEERSRFVSSYPECEPIELGSDRYENLVRERFHYLEDLSTWATKVEGQNGRAPSVL